MISNKKWKANGIVNRYLSEFIIQTEQHCRVYNYVHDEINGSDIEDIVDSNTGLYLRKSDYPQSNDVVSLEKFDLVNNSILFYNVPKNKVSVFLEVATTPEEFGGTIAQPAADQAKAYANEAEEYLIELKKYYMGSFDQEPTTGMVDGSMYFDNTASYIKIYNGLVWVGLNEMVETKIERETYTATAGQTNFSIVADYKQNNNQISVYKNGIYEKDFIENVSSITLNEACLANDIIEVVVFEITVLTSDITNRVYTIDTDTTIIVPTDYADINLALKSLDDKVIASDVTVTISVNSGSYEYTESINISHANSDRIEIAGASYINLNGLTSYVGATGVKGDWEVEISVGDTSSLSIDDWVIVSDTKGINSHPVLRGFWKVLSVIDSTNITILHTGEFDTFPGMTMNSGSNIFKLPSILNFTDCDGIVAKSGSIGELRNLGIVGARRRSTNQDEPTWYLNRWNLNSIGTHGIYSGGKTVVTGSGGSNTKSVSGGSISCGIFIGISGFSEQGLAADGGTNVFAEYVASSSNGRRGFYAASAAAIRCKFSSSTGNHLDGYIADYGGNIYNSISVAAANGWNGMSSTNNGSIATNDSKCYNNGYNGMFAKGSYIYCPTTFSFNNGINGFSAEYGGILYCNDSTSQLNGDRGLSLTNNSTARATNIKLKNNISEGLYIRSNCSVIATGMTNTSNGTAYYSENSEIIDGIGYYETILKTPFKDGIIMKTPDNLNSYRINIDNSGNITTTLI